MTNTTHTLLNTSFLFRRVDASSLGFIRIVMGLFLFVSFSKFQYYVSGFLIDSDYLFKYDGFEWVTMMPKHWLPPFFGLMYLSTALFVLGIHYRLNAWLLFLGYSYLFLLDKGHYNNHYYLQCILLFFFAISHADRWAALRATPPKDTTIPYWQLFLFQSQLFIVYFYGGLAKMQSDWLSGYPMRYWLFDESENAIEPIAYFFQTEFAAYFMSWSGLLFDLLIGFMLFSSKWRRIAWLPLLFFHVSNHFLWTIGIFPWLMLCLTSIYFAPNWARSAWGELIKSPKVFFYTILKTLYYKNLWKWLFPKGNPSTPSTFSEGKTNRVVLVGIIVLMGFQAIFPLRHLFYKGDPSWTGEGHLFAWRMMLMEDVGAFKMTVRIPKSGEEFPVSFESYMNFLQFSRISRTPKSILRFAHFIRDEVEQKGGVENPVIKLEIWKSVNERAPQLLNDTTLNYAEVQYAAIGRAIWLTDWSPRQEKPSFSLERFRHWKGFTERQDSMGM